MLTFETAFFERFGFREIEGAPVAPEVYQQLLQSFDEGVAEFLELLKRVNPRHARQQPDVAEARTRRVRRVSRRWTSASR